MAKKKKIELDALSAESLKTCTICSSEIEEENGDIVGYFGILPVAFCCWCLSSVLDMADQMRSHECEKCGHVNGEEDE